jgi:hypothetical protein
MRAPVGSAPLGLAGGDEIEWPNPVDRMLRVRIEGVLYQPGRTGDYRRQVSSSLERRRGRQRSGVAGPAGAKVAVPWRRSPAAYSRAVYGSSAPKPRWSMRSTRAPRGGWVLYSWARVADSLPSTVSFCSSEYRASGFMPARAR